MVGLLEICPESQSLEETFQDNELMYIYDSYTSEGKDAN